MSESTTQMQQRALGMDTWTSLRNQMQTCFNELDKPLAVMAKTPYKSVIGTRAHTFEGLYRWVECGVNTDDIYVCLNPSKQSPSAKPSLEDITDFKWMMLDFDPHPTLMRNYTPKDLLYKLTPQLREFFGHLPSFRAVDSGRGLQIWFPVNSGSSFDKDYCQRLIKGTTAALRSFLISDTAYYGYILDDACAELSHLARLPGTMNQKTKNYAKLLWTNIEHSLLITELAKWVAPAPPPPEPVQLPPANSKWFKHAIINGLYLSNRDFIRSGVNTDTESRHKRACSCARQLFELGCDADLGMYLLYEGAEKCSPSLNLSDPGYIRRLVKETWKT